MKTTQLGSIALPIPPPMRDIQVTKIPKMPKGKKGDGDGKGKGKKGGGDDEALDLSKSSPSVASEASPVAAQKPKSKQLGKAGTKPLSMQISVLTNETESDPPEWVSRTVCGWRGPGVMSQIKCKSNTTRQYHAV